MEPMNAARPTARLIRRATRRLARRLALDVAAFALLLASLRLAANRAAFDSTLLAALLFALFLLANGAAFFYLYRRKPGLYLAAKRLETNDPGLLTAALDLELDRRALSPPPAFADAIRRRAAVLIDSAERLPPDELEALLLDDGNDQARLARLERVARPLACLVLLAALAVPDRRLATPPAHGAASNAPTSSARLVEEEESAGVGDANESEFAPASTQGDAFDAFRAAILNANESAAALERNWNVAPSSPATLRRAAAVCRLARDPEFGPTPLARRALESAASNKIARPGARYSDDILAAAVDPFLNGEFHDMVSAMERAFLASPENDDARNALVDLRAILENASRLLALVALGRAFDAAVERYESSATLAFERARDALVARAGKFPGEDLDENDAVDAFRDALESVDDALLALRALYDDALEASRLAPPESLPSPPPSDVCDPVPRFARLDAFLDALNAEAAAERWGIVANSLVPAQSLERAFAGTPPDESPAFPVRLAFAVTFGEIPSSPASALDLSSAEPPSPPPDKAAPARDLERVDEGDDFDGDAVARSDAPESGSARSSDLETDSAREGNLGNGAELANDGTPADARGGGASRKGVPAPRDDASKEAFAAELPPAALEALDRARRWNPDDAERRRVDDYFNELRRVETEEKIF